VCEAMCVEKKCIVNRGIRRDVYTRRDVDEGMCVERCVLSDV